MKIRPFRALRYNPKNVPDLSAVVAPPYDVISPEKQNTLYQKSPHNMVRLILSRDPNPYESAAKHLNEWISEGILVRDPVPAIYLTEELFTDPCRGRTRRRGFIALAQLQDFSNGTVLPHEKTLAAPKRDRLNLLQACGANLSPIFGIYFSKERRIAGIADSMRSQPETARCVDGLGTEHRLWKIEDQDVLNAIIREMAPRQVLIADGHHRYETALAYRNLMRKKLRSQEEQPFDFVMMSFFNAEEDGLVIFPIHRLVSNIPGFDPLTLLKAIRSWAEVREFSVAAGREEEFVRAVQDATFGFVLAGIDQGFLVRTPEVSESSSLSRLGVVRLHALMFRRILGISEDDEKEGKNIRYTEDLQHAIHEVKTGKCQAAFFLNPPTIRQIWEVCRSGLTMPQKCTYFYPKLLTGLTINRFNF